jgi:hypothetical protein
MNSMFDFFKNDPVLSIVIIMPLCLLILSFFFDFNVNHPSHLRIKTGKVRNKWIIRFIILQTIIIFPLIIKPSDYFYFVTNDRGWMIIFSLEFTFLFFMSSYIIERVKDGISCKLPFDKLFIRFYGVAFVLCVIIYLLKIIKLLK